MLDIEELVSQISTPSAERLRIVVGIDGPGATGKSTLAELIRGRIKTAAVVHVDDFFLPSSIRNSRAGQLGSLFDLPRLEKEVLVPAANGQSFSYQKYDWDLDALAETVKVEAKSAVIVEGVYSFARVFAPYYSFSIYCGAEYDIRLRRGILRDGESMRTTWVEEWMPEESRYEVAESPAARADLVLDSSEDAKGDPEYSVVSHAEVPNRTKK